MLKHGTAYVRQSLADYEQHYRDRMIQNLTRRAKALGYALVQTPAGTPGVTVTSVEQFLGRPPLVKRQTTPESGFFLFFRLVWSRRSRHLASWPDFISVCWCRPNVAAPNTY